MSRGIMKQARIQIIVLGGTSSPSLHAIASPWCANHVMNEIFAGKKKMYPCYLKFSERRYCQRYAFGRVVGRLSKNRG